MPWKCQTCPWEKQSYWGGWVSALTDLNAVDVLVNIDGRGRAADAVDDGGYDGDPGSAGAANGDGGVPCAGAGVAIALLIERGAAAFGLPLCDDKSNVDAQDGAAVGISAGGAKDLSGADIDRNACRRGSA